LKKAVKIVSARLRTSVGLRRLGAPPQDPRVLIPACYFNFVEFVSCAKCNLLSSKRNKITAVNLCFYFYIFESIFHFKHCSFCSWGRKNIPMAQGTLATPLNTVINFSACFSCNSAKKKPSKLVHYCMSLT